jgi:hypothetical protein
MRRHSIIASIGHDTLSTSLADSDSQVSLINFIDSEHRLGFGLGQILIDLSSRGIYPSETAVDLLILAATVMAADTRIFRQTESQDSWTREIDLYIPVKEPALWMGNSSLLQRMLKFLTGDRWRVFFRPRSEGFENLVDCNGDFIKASFTSVSLFSGGLDSFVGAIDLLESAENPLFVSHYWDSSTSSQKVCAQLIGSIYGDMHPRHARARIGFPNHLIAGSEPEMTMRARSFLFFALGALAASSLNGSPAVYVPENGLISLNVPLDPLRLGAWSTRTTHPFYMARWQELLDRLHINAKIENPYRFKTKGEMLIDCRNVTFLQKNLASTVSCSSFTKGRYRGLSPVHCGYCIPCLIRRAAVHRAFVSDQTEYSIDDLAAETLNSRRADGRQIRAIQMMYRRLSSQPELAKILVHKSGPLSDYTKKEIAEYAYTFKRGITEVGSFVENVVVRST